MSDASVKMKVFCPDNDQVGTVTADRDGLLITYRAAVWHTGGSVFGSENMVTDRLADDEVGELGAYCKRCKRPVTLSVRGLRIAGLAGLREIDAPYSAAPLNPSNVKWLRRDPRRSDD